MAGRRTSSQLSPQISPQCGQSATHDVMFLYSPAMFIGVMLIRNIKRGILNHISQESILHAHGITMLQTVGKLDNE